MSTTRSRVVRAAHSPLGFFVLALLIVEAFLWGAGVWFGLPESWRLIALGVGVGLFLIVVGLVVWLVIKFPQNLVFSEESHVQVAALKLYGNETIIAEQLRKTDLPVLKGTKKGSLPLK
jgi:hypothetical protein